MYIYIYSVYVYMYKWDFVFGIVLVVLTSSHVLVYLSPKGFGFEEQRGLHDPERGLLGLWSRNKKQRHINE